MDQTKRSLAWRASSGAVHNIGRIFTVLLIVFQLALPLLRYFTGDAMIAAIREVAWFPLIVYLNFQLYETTKRDPTNLLGFFLDSLLAIVSVLIGIIFFALLLLTSGNAWISGARGDEAILMLHVTVISVSDVVWGALISMRIAFAGKERGEFERPAQRG